MAKLKELKDITKTAKLKGTIPSGFKSDDSSGNVELIIAEPLIKHPEINGLYRAFDPETGWKTWVEYIPPVIVPEPTPEPTPEQIKRTAYEVKYSELQKKKEFVELGLLVDSDINSLRNEVKLLAQELGEI